MLYKIRNWNKNFENNRTRDMKNMSWVPIPNKLDGDGYLALIEHKDGAALFGAWVACIEVASKCDPRGTLVRDNGSPHSTKTLSRITRIPESTIGRMLELCSVDPMWIEITDLQEGAELPQEGAELPPQGVSLGNRIEQKRKEQNYMYRPLSELLKKRVLETTQSKITESHLDTWDNECRLMVEQDKRKTEDIELLINECHNMEPRGANNFTWRKQIKSMSKLRLQWNNGNICIGMNKGQQQSQEPKRKNGFIMSDT